MTSRKDKPSKRSKPVGSMGSDAARKIWLAGIGAYGRAFSEAQEGLSKASKGTGRVFDDLVEKGEVIEAMVSYKGKEMAKDALGKVGSGTVVQNFDLDGRIAKMRARLKRSDHEDISSVEERLDIVEAKLDEILKALAPKKPAARKKSPVKKAKK